MSVDINCPEYRFFKQIIERFAKVIFDVGCRFDSVFSNFEGDVHYFEPNGQFLEKLKPLVHNSHSYFNNFGLSDKNESLEYYNEQQSFVHRKLTHPDTYMNWTKSVFEVKRADEYIQKNNIKSIDFLKIDTEGFEFNVLKGGEITFAKYKPTLIIEIWDKNLEEVTTQLNKMNYLLLKHIGGHDYIFTYH